MERKLFVYVDVDGESHFVGRMWTRVRGGRESATFEYDRSWLIHPRRFSLEPALALAPGPFHTPHGRPLFGAMGDSAPDRWGRVLMRRAERRRAEALRETPRSLLESDYLLMVDDEARQGALRFAEAEGGEFLAKTNDTKDKIPPLLELPKLLKAASHVVDEKDTDEDLRLLLIPGSSLGGARPKASVRDKDGRLAIAKFPHKTDEVKTILWEAVALTLAAKAGIPTPEWRLETVARRPVLILRRFDRDVYKGRPIRTPFLSAMSMLGAADGEPRSYIEFVDTLHRHGASPKADSQAVWRRVVFNILISNTDDHLRNHGFVWVGLNGWRPSPAYDLNPTPPDLRPRVLSTMIDEHDSTASMEIAFNAAGYYKLKPEEARKVAAEVARAVSTWRKTAAQFGATEKDIERMSTAFEHRDLRAAKGQRTLAARPA